MGLNAGVGPAKFLRTGVLSHVIPAGAMLDDQPSNLFRVALWKDGSRGFVSINIGSSAGVRDDLRPFARNNLVVTIIVGGTTITASGFDSDPDEPYESNASGITTLIDRYEVGDTGSISYRVRSSP